MDHLLQLASSNLRVRPVDIPGARFLLVDESTLAKPLTLIVLSHRSEVCTNEKAKRKKLPVSRGLAVDEPSVQDIRCTCPLPTYTYIHDGLLG